MNSIRPALLFGALILGSFAPPSTHAQAAAKKATGPLRVHPTNPRYFADSTGRAVYLTGSHVWNNLQDQGTTSPPPAFDFDAYLGFLEKHGHNFVRLWRFEITECDNRVERLEPNDGSPSLHGPPSLEAHWPGQGPRRPAEV